MTLKNLKPPIKPNKPIKPTKPEKNYSTCIETPIIISGETIKSFIEMLSQYPPHFQLWMEDPGYDVSGCSEIFVKGMIIKEHTDHKYNELMKEYNKRLKKYEERLIEYEKKFLKYQEELKVYIEFLSKDAIEDLKSKIEKEINKLKKEIKI